MKRIFLNDDQKKILFSLNKNSDSSVFMESWERGRRHYAIEDLINKNLVTAKYYEDTDYINCRLTSFGEEYLLFNSKLKNPLSEKAVGRKRFWTGIYGNVISSTISFVIGLTIGYYIPDKYPDDHEKKPDEPIVNIQKHNGNMMLDTIIMNKEQTTDFSK